MRVGVWDIVVLPGEVRLVRSEPVFELGSRNPRKRREPLSLSVSGLAARTAAGSQRSSREDSPDAVYWAYIRRGFRSRDGR
ncbi:hypothetical protein GCM10025787_24780 [Saccharopolyspora rosea]